jgi:hypothetical protein
VLGPGACWDYILYPYIGDHLCVATLKYTVTYLIKIIRKPQNNTSGGLGGYKGCEEATSPCGITFAGN